MNDPEKKVEYHSLSKKHWGQDVSFIEIENQDDIDYSVRLIKQVIKRFDIIKNK
ncbi:MAG: hypothetical protein HC932_02110 [Thermales bacterium]|nr:hypothetical protein [Thermales bacterium]